MGRDHSIECETCGESYGGMNAESEEHECNPARDFAVCFEMGTVEFKCQRCTDGTTSDSYCSHCDGQGVLIEYVKTWFDNLAIVAAMCAAYEQGYRCGYVANAVMRSEEAARLFRANQDKMWSPNAYGRVAPGWRSE